MKNDFLKLFEYNHHYNIQLIDLLLENENVLNQKIQFLLNHILNAHQIWNARILNLDTFEVHQINDYNQLQNIDELNFKNSFKILNQFDLNTIVTYKNSKQIQFSNQIKDILFHVINHSTYHRGQLASFIKQVGIEPINTDYIFYVRDKSQLSL